MEIKNWRPVENGTVGIYEPDERWRVRVTEAAIVPAGAGRRWSVRLYFNGEIRYTIAANVRDKDDARGEMTSWVHSHGTIVADE